MFFSRCSNLVDTAVADDDFDVSDVTFMYVVRENTACLCLEKDESEGGVKSADNNSDVTISQKRACRGRKTDGRPYGKYGDAFPTRTELRVGEMHGL